MPYGDGGGSEYNGDPLGEGVEKLEVVEEAGLARPRNCLPEVIVP